MRNFCNRVAVMLRGEIVETGNVETVFGAPQHPYTRALLAAIPVTTDAAEAQKPFVTTTERAAVLNATTAIGEI